MYVDLPASFFFVLPPHVYVRERAKSLKVSLLLLLRVPNGPIWYVLNSDQRLPSKQTLILINSLLLVANDKLQKQKSELKPYATVKGFLFPQFWLLLLLRSKTHIHICRERQQKKKLFTRFAVYFLLLKQGFSFQFQMLIHCVRMRSFCFISYFC